MSTELITNLEGDFSVFTSGPMASDETNPMNAQQQTAASDSQQTIELPAQNGHEGLLSASFLGLLITQFLGAMNDNIFRWLVAWIGGDRAISDPVFQWLVAHLGKDLSPDKYKEIAVSAGVGHFWVSVFFFAPPAG